MTNQLCFDHGRRANGSGCPELHGRLMVVDGRDLKQIQRLSWRWRKTSGKSQAHCQGRCRQQQLVVILKPGAVENLRDKKGAKLGKMRTESLLALWKQIQLLAGMFLFKWAWGPI